jgi:hypothetical protein
MENQIDPAIKAVSREEIENLIREYSHLELSEYRHNRHDGARVAQGIVIDLQRLIGVADSAAQQP